MHRIRGKSPYIPIHRIHISDIIANYPITIHYKYLLALWLTIHYNNSTHMDSYPISSPHTSPWCNNWLPMLFWFYESPMNGIHDNYPWQLSIPSLSMTTIHDHYPFHPTIHDNYPWQLSQLDIKKISIQIFQWQLSSYNYHIYIYIYPNSLPFSSSPGWPCRGQAPLGHPNILTGLRGIQLVPSSVPA